MQAFCCVQNLCKMFVQKCCTRKELISFNIIIFLFKNRVVIPFDMLSPKITTPFSAPLVYLYRTFRLGQLTKIHFVDQFWRRLPFDFSFAVLDVLILVASFDGQHIDFSGDSFARVVLVGQVDFVLMAADISTDVIDGRFVVLALLDQIIGLLLHPRFSQFWFKNNVTSFNNLFMNGIRRSYICKTSEITLFGA